MPVCALCEHEQPAGEACDACGRPLPGARGAAAGPVAPLAELEPTRQAAVDEEGPPLAELEPTRAAPVAAPPAALAELEATAHAPTGEPDPFAFAAVELEPTSAAPAPSSPTPRGPLVCRYCGTASTAWEKLCLRCGMRLPVLRPVGARRAAAAVPRRCGDCGQLLDGPMCRACGARPGRA